MTALHVLAYLPTAVIISSQLSTERPKRVRAVVGCEKPINMFPISVGRVMQLKCNYH